VLLQCVVAVCCTLFQCVPATVCCAMFQSAVVCSSIVQRGTLVFSMMQRYTDSCSMLQQVAVWCAFSCALVPSVACVYVSVTRETQSMSSNLRVAVYCTELQSVTVCCNVSYYVVVCYRVAHPVSTNLLWNGMNTLCPHLRGSFPFIFMVTGVYRPALPPSKLSQSYPVVCVYQ